VARVRRHRCRHWRARFRRLPAFSQGGPVILGGGSHGLGALPANWWAGSPVLANFKAQNPHLATSNPIVTSVTSPSGAIGMKPGGAVQVAPVDDYVFPTGMATSTKVAIGFGVIVAAFAGYKLMGHKTVAA
jgi:hypothetical protein